jgi:regulator of CtrA degradation
MDRSQQSETINQIRLKSKLVSSLYVEAMVLADEARSYFDEAGRSERDALSGFDRVNFSCESLKITTRLMHIIAWLLVHRAVDAGEISAFEAAQPTRRLGGAADSEGESITKLPDRARNIVEASRDLYARVQWLDQGLETRPVSSPARGLLDRLQNHF